MQKLKVGNKFDERGLKAATYFKFYRQEFNPNIVRALPIERIQAKTFYLEHRYHFNKLVAVFTKYNLNVENYIEFFTTILKKSERDIDTHLLNQYTVQLFVEHLEIRHKQKKIVKYIIKSAKNIAKECIKYNYTTSIDYFRMLISKRKLVNYYISGKISKYFLVLIPNFQKIITKLDSLSKDEFRSVCNMYEKYNIDSVQALKKHKIHIRNVFTFTDEIIKKYI